MSWEAGRDSIASREVYVQLYSQTYTISVFRTTVWKPRNILVDIYAQFSGCYIKPGEIPDLNVLGISCKNKLYTILQIGKHWQF